MGTLIGFKHLLYLVEDAVLQWFRHRGFGPRRLFCEHGLALQLVDVSARLVHVLDIDDEATAEVRATQPGRFAVTLSTARNGARTTVLRARVTVELFGRDTAPRGTLPDELLAMVTDNVVTAAPAARRDHRVLAGRSAREVLAPNGSNRLWWAWKARYLYCHYFDRVQHSAYIRALEEVVDRFLAERGLSVESVLDERGWIPVVSKVRVQILAAAHLGETIHTTFAVEGITDRTYDGRMDCHVQRVRDLIHVATATITHGYIQIRPGDLAARALKFDGEVVGALTSG